MRIALNARNVKRKYREGVEIQTFNSTNLVQHLRKLSEEFKKYEKEKADNASKQAKAPQQLSLPETLSHGTLLILVPIELLATLSK